VHLLYRAITLQSDLIRSQHNGNMNGKHSLCEYIIIKVYVRHEFLKIICAQIALICLNVQLMCMINKITKVNTMLLQ